MQIINYIMSTTPTKGYATPTKKSPAAHARSIAITVDKLNENVLRSAAAIAIFNQDGLHDSVIRAKLCQHQTRDKESMGL